MRYKIQRECWSKNTYNGYTDNPYWLININGNQYGLNDNGKLWSISNLLITEHTIIEIENIIKECNLHIIINQQSK